METQLECDEDTQKVGECLEWQMVKTALHACIEHHGPITHGFVPSATQRVLSVLAFEGINEISPATAANLVTMLNIKYEKYINLNKNALKERYLEGARRKAEKEKSAEINELQKRIDELEKEVEDYKAAVTKKSVELGLCLEDAAVEKYNKLLRENIELKAGISDERVKEIVAENERLKQKLLVASTPPAPKNESVEIRHLEKNLQDMKNQNRQLRNHINEITSWLFMSFSS